MNIVEALKSVKIELLNFKKTTNEKISEISASEQAGKTLTEHLAEEDMVLSSRQYGDTLPGEDGEPYTHIPGRIFFKRVSG